MELDELREALAVSDRPEIARRSGVTYRTIDNIIHGRLKGAPHATTRAALERALKRTKKPKTTAHVEEDAD